MSQRNAWQRICQIIEKSFQMNQGNKELQEENLENIHENETETASTNETLSNEIPEEKSVADELAELKDRNLRLFAEFENFRKRTSKERLELYKTANEGLLVDLLPVLDDFERGMNEINKSEDVNLVKGVQLIQEKLVNTLKNKGLDAMEINAGDDFDVEKHEAITQIPAPSDALKGKIVDVVETGYSLNDKVIRYAKVVVGK